MFIPPGPRLSFEKGDFWRKELLILAFLPKQGYTMIHETKRKCRSTGSSKTTGGDPLGERFGHSGSSPAGRGITILCETLEGPDPSLPKNRAGPENLGHPRFANHLKS
jgi:hypothetical protein